MSQGFSGNPNALTDGHILVGNSAGVATDVAMSGDVTIADTGATTIKTNVALAGSPTTTTQSVGDNTTKIATTAFAAAGFIPQLGAASTTTKTLSRWSGTAGGALLASAVQLTDNNELYNERDWLVTETTTSRLLGSTDIGTVIYTTNASTVAVTLPNNMPIGSRISLIQGAAGQIQLTAASGATLQHFQSFTATAKIYAQITLEVVANAGGSSAVYNLTGDAGLANGTFAKSVQQFTITIAASATSGTATINAVTTANSFIMPGGQYNSVSTWDGSLALCSLVLTNTTTVTATRGASDTGTIAITGTVVELVSGVVNSIQSGTCTYVTTATTATATITSVVAGNSFVVYNGQTLGSTSTSFAATLSWLTLTNATTVTATRSTGTSLTSLAVNFTVVELKAGVVHSAPQQSGAVIPSTVAALSVIVNPKYTFSVPSGWQSNVATSNGNGLAGVFLANGVSWGIIETVSGGIDVAPTFVELDSTKIKQVQRGGIQIASGAATGNTAILNTDSTRTMITNLGWYSPNSGTTGSGVWLSMTQSSGTNILATRAGTPATILNGSFESVEFL